MKLQSSVAGLEHHVIFELAFAHGTGEILLFSYHPLHRDLAGRVVHRCSLSGRGPVEVDAHYQQQNADHHDCANQR